MSLCICVHGARLQRASLHVAHARARACSCVTCTCTCTDILNVGPTVHYLLCDRYQTLHSDLRAQKGVQYLRQMADGAIGAGVPLAPYPWHQQEGQRLRLPDSLSCQDLSGMSFLLPSKPFAARWRSQ
jgi:hypothetical protein